MLNKVLLKALEPYSRAFIISVIWDDVSKEEKNNYRQRIHSRMSGKVSFTKLETEKLTAFFKEQSEVLSAALRCV